jgi:hypothetical protein
MIFSLANDRFSAETENWRSPQWRLSPGLSACRAPLMMVARTGAQRPPPGVVATPRAPSVPSFVTIYSGIKEEPPRIGGANGRVGS